MWLDVYRALMEVENQGGYAAKTANPAKRDAQLAELAELASLQGQNSDIALTDARDDALDAYEERAAIREFDGRQTRAEAEAAALAEAARGAGLNANSLLHLWTEHPDTRAYLVHVSATGPSTCGNAAAALRWDGKRAWQAEARLRAALRALTAGRAIVHVATH